MTKQNRKRAGVLILSTLLGIALSAQAASDNVMDILTHQQKIRADVSARKNGWDNIPADQRQELLSKQDRLSALINGKRSLDDLAPADREKAVQTIEWIDALAAKADDERQVCTSERATGSNRVTRVCRTAGSIRRQREQTMDVLSQGHGAR